MSYKPRNVPTDPAALPEYLRAELNRLAQELESAQPILRVSQTNVAPDKPREGDVRLQDGTNWAGVSGGEQPVWFDGTNWQPFSDIGGPYDCGGYYPSTPGASVMMMRHVFVRDVSFPADLAGSKASAVTAATAQTDFDLKKNNVSFGTMRFAAAATTCTFVGVSATTFTSADVLTVISPGTPDATLADIGWMFAGVRT